MLTPFTALILPAVLATVVIFFVSSLIHMFSPWHKSDYAKLPDEAGVMTALRAFNLQPDEYLAPKMSSMADMKSPAYLEKRRQGPVFTMTVFPNTASFSQVSNMINWFIYCLVISLVAGLVTSSIVPPGGDHRVVLHYVAIIAFLAYVGALFQASIWFHKKWSTTFKSTFDGAIYAVITGLAFAMLWPKM